jgi:hypothetical protein
VAGGAGDRTLRRYHGKVDSWLLTEVQFLGTFNSGAHLWERLRSRCTCETLGERRRERKRTKSPWSPGSYGFSRGAKHRTTLGSAIARIEPLGEKRHKATTTAGQTHKHGGQVRLGEGQTGGGRTRGRVCPWGRAFALLYAHQLCLYLAGCYPRRCASSRCILKFS